MSVVWLILGNAAVCVGAHEILLRIRSGSRSIDAVLFLLLRLLLISAVVLMSGLLGLLTASLLGAVATAVLAVLIWSGALKRIEAPRLPNPGVPLAILAGAIALRLLMQVWFFSPSYGDVVTYHLPKVAEWVSSGAIRSEVGGDPRGWFPAGFELIEAWWVVFLHHDVLIEAAGLEFLILGVTAAYALARRLGQDGRTSLLAAAIYGMTPGLQLQAVSCLNDAPVAAMMVALIALIQAGAELPLILMTVLLGVGIKPTFLFLMPGPVLLYLWTRRERKPASSGPVVRTLLPLVALGVGSFWYLRNLTLFGSPIYPMGTEICRQMQQVGPAWSSFTGNLANLVNSRVYDDARAPSATALYVSNWGAAVFALGAPALLFRVRTDGGLRRLVLCGLVSVACVFFLVVPDPWAMRFILFFPILPALALAPWTFEFRLIPSVLSAVLILEGVSATVPDEYHPDTLKRMVRQSWRERTTLPSAPSVPAGETVGFVPGSSGPLYLLYGPDFNRRVVLMWESTLAEFEETLRRRSIRVFYVGDPGPGMRRMLEEGAEKSGWTRFSDGFGPGYRVTSTVRDP